MRTEGSYPTPVHGISTLSPRNRARGQAGLQENFRSDPVNKLTRRPSLSWDADLIASTSANIKHHSYRRDGKEYKILVEEDGTVSCFVDKVNKTVIGNLAGYITSKATTKLSTINDTTFVLNTTKKVTMVSSTDLDSIENVSHINVVSAMNYGETVLVTVYESRDPEIKHSATFSTPLVGAAIDFDAADQARATNNVATQLGVLLSGVDPDIHTRRGGSSVAIWRTNGEWLEVEIDSGQGDNSIVAVNKKIEKVDGLPLLAVHGTRIEVQPNPRSEKGIYFLEATGTSEEAEIPADPLDRKLEEVVWTEHRSPTENFEIDADTMPHTIEYNAITDDFTVGVPSVGWNERRTGDDDSAPRPHFVGREIADISYFQKRLLFLSDDTVSMTETDDLFNWWKASAVKLLVTDPISISSSTSGIDKLSSVVTHNRDLLIVASNGQFKIDGSTAITPQTVSMPLVTKYEVQVDTPPVSIGNKVYLPLDYGDSSGLQSFRGRRQSEQDVARPISHQIIGYMSGKIDILVGNSNLNMLAMTTTNALNNELFIFEQFETESGKIQQQSWSKWIIPTTTTIIDMTFTKDDLELICHENGRIISKSIKMYSIVATNTLEIFLDDLITLDSTDGLTVTAPTNYLIDNNTIIVAGDNTDYPLSQVAFTNIGNAITFDENISTGAACKVYIGKKNTPKYRPTRPFRYDENGIAVTSDRLNVSKFILNVTDTARISMKIISEFSDFEDQEFNARILGDSKNLIGSTPIFTGDVKFSYAQKADLAEAEFYTDSYLGLTISGISWAGKYYQSSRRM